MFSGSLTGLLPFLSYFGTGIAAMLIFMVLYAMITPFSEWRLVRQQHNQAAGLSIAGALLGFSLPLASAAQHSISYSDFLIWTVIAMAVQLLTFTAVRFALIPTIVSKVENNQIAGALVLASINIGVGLLNAACMSY